MPHNPDPAKVVWYIEARPQANPRLAPKAGTAVAVLLRNRASRQTRAFLLTSAHTLRGVRDSPLEEVLCWRPGTGYTSPDEHPNRVSGQCPGSMRAVVKLAPPLATPNPADDWTLLDVDDREFQSCAVAHGWGTPNERDSLRIAGYPGGAEFPNRVVQPTVKPDFRADRDANPGTLRLSGPHDTARGMSGGGVFTQDGRLVGIHREHRPGDVAFIAVSLDEVRTRLAAEGWDFEPPPPPLSTPAPAPVCAWWFALAAVVLLALGALIWALWPPPADPDSNDTDPVVAPHRNSTTISLKTTEDATVTATNPTIDPSDTKTGDTTGGIIVRKQPKRGVVCRNVERNIRSFLPDSPKSAPVPLTIVVTPDGVSATSSDTATATAATKRLRKFDLDKYGARGGKDQRCDFEYSWQP